MVPAGEQLYPGIVKLLVHFQWTWIGLIASDTDNGEKFMRAFPPLVSRSGVCVAFSLSIPTTHRRLEDTTEFFFSSEAFGLWREVNVLVYYGESLFFEKTFLFIDRLATKWIKPPAGKIWITTALWDLTFYLNEWLLSSEHIYGVFSFLIWKNRQRELGRYISLYSKLMRFGSEAFNCSYSKPVLSVKGKERCAERENLETLSQDVIEAVLSDDSYLTFHVLHAVARALHATLSLRSKQQFSRDRFGPHTVQPWQVLCSLHR